MDSLITQSHKPLCHTVKKEIELKDEDYEYMPPTYTEYICTNPEKVNSNILSKESHMCNFPGFECVQRRKSMMVAKRRKGTEVWEFYTQRIASDCDCMLPVIQLPSQNYPIQ